MPGSDVRARTLIAALPLLVVALVAGAAGYLTASPGTEPVPALAPRPSDTPTLRGRVESTSGDEVSIVTDAGARLSFRLGPSAPVESLAPISVADLKQGDWINGGAIPHPQTVFALTGLVVVPQPVLPP